MTSKFMLLVVCHLSPVLSSWVQSTLSSSRLRFGFVLFCFALIGEVELDRELRLEIPSESRNPTDEGKEELWEPEEWKTLGEHALPPPPESTLQGSGRLTETEETVKEPALLGSVLGLLHMC